VDTVKTFGFHKRRVISWPPQRQKLLWFIQLVGYHSVDRFIGWQGQSWTSPLWWWQLQSLVRWAAGHQHTVHLTFTLETSDDKLACRHLKLFYFTDFITNFEASSVPAMKCRSLERLRIVSWAYLLRFSSKSPRRYNQMPSCVLFLHLEA
jgi:hypothetical protein